MSSLRQLYMALASGAIAGVVTVSGEGVFDISNGVRTYTATIRFNSDGTVDQIENTTTMQVDSGTDWIIPNGAAPDDYEIRYTAHSGQALDGVTNLTEDIWAPLSTSRSMSITQVLSSAESQSASFTIEVRKGSAGGALDSAVYTLDIENLF